MPAFDIVVVSTARGGDYHDEKKSVTERRRKRKINKRTRIKGNIMAKSAWTKLPLARPDDHTGEHGALSARKRKGVLLKKTGRSGAKDQRL
jgi:hypothetical protein